MVYELLDQLVIDDIHEFKSGSLILQAAIFRTYTC